MAHRIYVLTLDRILDREISQADLLNGSISLDLSPDLLDSPSIMLLSSPKLTSAQTNPAPDGNPVDEDEPVNPPDPDVQGIREKRPLDSVAFVCYHGEHLCKYEISC